MDVGASAATENRADCVNLQATVNRKSNLYFAMLGSVSQQTQGPQTGFGTPCKVVGR